MNKKFISVVLSVVFIINCFVITTFAEQNTTVGADSALRLMNSMSDYLKAQTKQDRIDIFHLVHSYMETDVGVETLINLVDDQSTVEQSSLILGFINSFGISETEKSELKFFLRFAKSIPTQTRVKAYKILDDREEYVPTSTLTTEEDQAITDIYNAFIDSDLATMLADDHGLNRMVIFNFLITLGKEIAVTDSATDANDFDMYSITPAFAQRIGNDFALDTPTLNGESWVTGMEFMNILLGTLNSSADFTDALNASAKKILGRSDIGIYFPRPAPSTGVAINNPENLIQTSPETIEFEAEVDPGANPESVEWYVNGQKQVITGKNFTFVPSTYGTYEIYAVITDVNGQQVKSETKVVATVTPITPTSKPSQSSGGGSSYVQNTAKPTSTPSGELKEIPEPPVVAKSSYSDANDHWAKDYLEALGAKGIFKGYEDGTIRPDLGVTREEMAVLLTRILGVTEKGSSGTKYYTDNNAIQSYAREAVYVLSDMNIYLGYGDGSFQPQNILTREEIISLFGRIIGEIELDEISFTDNDVISYWSYESIQKLCSYGIIGGYPDGSIKPLADVTRGEAAVMIYKLMYRLGKL